MTAARAGTGTSAVGIVPRATIHPPLPKRVPGTVLAALQRHVRPPADVRIRLNGHTSPWFTPTQAPHARVGLHRNDLPNARPEGATSRCR